MADIMKQLKQTLSVQTEQQLFVQRRVAELQTITC